MCPRRNIVDTIVDSKATRKRHYRRYTPEERQRIVAETMQPGVSVASVARRHGMNDNMIFGWRKKFRDQNPRMLPVTVSPEPSAQIKIGGATATGRAVARGDTTIEICTPAGHVIRIGASADPSLVQTVLATLRG
jgi:transposase